MRAKSSCVIMHLVHSLQIVLMESNCESPTDKYETHIRDTEHVLY